MGEEFKPVMIEDFVAVRAHFISQFQMFIMKLLLHLK